MNALYRAAFALLCIVGRPFGGIRPRRIYHWLAHRAYATPPASDAEYRWRRDGWGFEFRLHPHFHLDRYIIAFGSYEPDLLRFLHARVRPGMVCFDVGANLGQIAVHMAKLVGPTGRVHAFEPVPHIRDRMRRHVERNRIQEIVELHEVALSDQNGSAVFHEGSPDRENQGMGSLISELPEGEVVEREVKTARLDDFAAQHGIDRIDLMKIDIQGAELMLLEGAAKTLDRLAPALLMEVSPEDLRALGRTPADLVAALEASGYRVHEIHGSEIGRRLDPEDLAENYWASGVYCTKTASP